MGDWRPFRRMKGALRDQRGGILVTAALAMMPITMLALAGVEFSNYTRQRTALQDALDSAALAVARAPVTATEAQLRDVYVGVLRAHLDLRPGLVDLVVSDATATAPAQPQFTAASGRISASATLAIAPVIASFFIDGKLLIRGGSEVMRESKGLEVALVLDNTWSMNTNNRIGITRTAASEFVDLMSAAGAGTATANPVKIGLVPFDATVNVGSGYGGSAWLDTGAQSPIHAEIFTTNRGLAVSPSPNRFSLLQAMGVSWAGCVESRPAPYDIQDTAPSSATPATLFVPYFAPDEPDMVTNAGAYRPTNERTWDGISLQTFDYPNDYLPDLIAAVAGYDTRTDQLGYYWPYVMDWRPHAASPHDQIHTYVGTTLANGWKGIQGVSTKYNGAAVDAYTANIAGYSRAAMSAAAAPYGPNKGCTPKPVSRLTTNYAGLKTQINAMTANGSTNIPMGLVWGWHLLSPNLPFQDGAAYGAKGVTKVAILMTDGENSVTTDAGSNAANLNGSEYTGIGYVWQNRVGTTSGDWTARRNAMDARLTSLCSNMKAKGIVLYTIRVEVTGGSPDVLRNCATSPSQFFDVKQASELTGAFRKIAQSVQNLRISA